MVRIHLLSHFRTLPALAVLALGASGCGFIRDVADQDDGNDGRDGRPGAQGKPGISGPQGPTGKDGLPGANGETGPQGPAGMAGRDGQDGGAGPQGAQGEAGPQGLPGATGPQGVAGQDGQTGQDGADAWGEPVTLELEASRTYSPSAWTNYSGTAVAGLYVIPETLPLVSGAAGTGWAYIQLGAVRYCYQGNGGNVTLSGTAFVLKGFRRGTHDCSLGGLSPLAGDVLLAQEGTLTVSVAGGGLSSCLQMGGTTVQAVLQIVPRN
jgi:hypothetical protein